MSEEKKTAEKTAKAKKPEKQESILVEVTYTDKSVKAGQKARLHKTVANMLAKQGKVIINK